jgi:hypothetical protein
MYVCPFCACTIESERFSGVRARCPSCGEAVQSEAVNPWTDVARVANLAEAGFLTDELTGLEIDARIYQLEEFSALTDRWNTVYLIRVPAESAREAAAYIRRHLADDVDESPAQAVGFRFSSECQTVDPLFWRPVALVVLAGVASFLAGQRFSEQNAERRPLRGSLTTTVRAIGRPFVTESAAGQPRYRLSLDRRHDTWFLDTDLDGDGNFDSRRRFQTSAVAW